MRRERGAAMRARLRTCVGQKCLMVPTTALMEMGSGVAPAPPSAGSHFFGSIDSRSKPHSRCGHEVRAASWCSTEVGRCSIDRLKPDEVELDLSAGMTLS